MGVKVPLVHTSRVKSPRVHEIQLYPTTTPTTISTSKSTYPLTQSNRSTSGTSMASGASSQTYPSSPQTTRTALPNKDVNPLGYCRNPVSPTSIDARTITPEAESLDKRDRGEGNVSRYIRGWAVLKVIFRGCFASGRVCMERSRG